MRTNDIIKLRVILNFYLTIGLHLIALFSLSILFIIFKNIICYYI